MAKFSRAEVRRIVGEACTDEIENALIALHLGVVDPMKDELNTAKADAEKLPGVQKELDKLKAEKNDGENWKLKYDALKADTEKEKISTSKKNALRALLKKIGIAEKRIDTVIKVSNLDDIKINDKGEIENADDLEKSYKTEYADFIPNTETQGAQTANPPANTGGKKYSNKEEILNIKDTAERQRAIAENLTLFRQ